LVRFGSAVSFSSLLGMGNFKKGRNGILKVQFLRFIRLVEILKERSSYK